METEIIKIWPGDENVSLTAFYDAGGEKHPAIVVLPGGGYMACAPREGDPVALHFHELGYTAFTLRYSTMGRNFREISEEERNPHTVFPEPMRQVAAAIKYIRDNCEKFAVDPNRIALMGFSAGGHLAANYCNFWNDESVYAVVTDDAETVRPNADILCYAVTEMRPIPSSTNDAVLGKSCVMDLDILRKYSPVYHVGAATPPSFLWHCVTDKVIPYIQSVNMANALAASGIKTELHIYGFGEHACALAKGLEAESWSDLADSFLRKNM